MIESTIVVPKVRKLKVLAGRLIEHYEAMKLGEEGDIYFVSTLSSSMLIKCSDVDIVITACYKNGKLKTMLMQDTWDKLNGVAGEFDITDDKMYYRIINCSTTSRMLFVTFDLESLMDLGSLVFHMLLTKSRFRQRYTLFIGNVLTGSSQEDVYEIAYLENLNRFMRFDEKRFKALCSSGNVGNALDNGFIDPSVPKFMRGVSNQCWEYLSGETLMLFFYNPNENTKELLFEVIPALGVYFARFSDVYVLMGTPDRVYYVLQGNNWKVELSLHGTYSDRFKASILNSGTMSVLTQYLKFYGLSVDDWVNERIRLMSLFGVTTEEAVLERLPDLL